MDEVSKCRRNLLVISSLLILYEIAGGKLAAVNAPVISITLERPQMVLYFMWLVLLYELIRFKALYREEHAKFKTDRSFICFSPKTLSKLSNLLPESSNSNGFTLKRGIFTRVITYHVYQDGDAKSKSVAVSYFRLFTDECREDLNYALQSKHSLEYSLPIIWSVFAI